eukprot:scaffold191037_cov31-Tisochrysis_lutea.AAC.2
MCGRAIVGRKIKSTSGWNEGACTAAATLPGKSRRAQPARKVAALPRAVLGVQRVHGSNEL